jgi:hypothetical protein
MAYRRFDPALNKKASDREALVAKLGIEPGPPKADMCPRYCCASSTFINARPWPDFNAFSLAIAAFLVVNVSE